MPLRFLTGLEARQLAEAIDAALEILEGHGYLEEANELREALFLLNRLQQIEADEVIK